ncbi:MAG: tripartite tricarboxylate transporter substrate binding protein, partial [Proteobacteria bacterium]|nr:tripartite tricarboxylate transporter substrate binding protein [Pseudomonadota bacterium]
MLKKRIFGAALLGALLGLGMSQALAQGAFPNRPVRIIVPITTGGSNDILARVIADRLSPVLGQPV